MSSNEQTLKSTYIETKLGPMLAIADDEKLYLLEFVEQQELEQELGWLTKKLKATIIPGKTAILKSIEFEIAKYFKGENLTFKTPMHFTGTPFQKNVWKELTKIPLSETRSYLDIAKLLKKPTAFRAVAQANGANLLAIIVPCHRVINSNGALGGYSSGIERKKWLLEHEKSAR